jgi:predicted solute-binding protein
MPREDEPPATHPATGRIGSVPYLNAVPLTHGLESETVFLPPSRLGPELRAGRLDAALLSVTEALFHEGHDLLAGPGVVSRGPVYSVGVAHRVPLEDVRELHVDTASCTSVNLLRVFLARRGLSPRLVPLADYSAAPSLDAVMLIGNAAIDFRRAGHAHAWWDFGATWWEEERLPFVYAAWVLRRVPGLAGLHARLRRAAAEGVAALPRTVADRTEYDVAFRRRYLGGWIHFDIDDAARAGVARFAECLRGLGGAPVFEPRWVG